MASSAVLLLIVMAVAATARGRTHPADGTPAAQFWEAALPDTPMPESIANLVQKGADRSPLDGHHSSALYLPNKIQIAVYNRNKYGDGTLCGGAHPHPDSSQAVELGKGLVFHVEDMRVGGPMTVYLPPSDPAPFLPRDAADRIPFGNLTDALTRFGIAPSSEAAARMGETVSVCRCHTAPITGERKACATSLEGIVLSAMHMLATSRLVAAASTVRSSGLPRGEYIVEAIRPLGAAGDRRFVACHSSPYPYAVYECHMAEGSSQAYVVSIRGCGLPTVDMAALCHFDTSNWDPAHPAFKILGTHPGGAPVCHFLSYADLVFGEMAANNA